LSWRTSFFFRGTRTADANSTTNWDEFDYLATSIDRFWLAKSAFARRKKTVADPDSVELDLVANTRRSAPYQSKSPRPV
jgi:hypothetical protein